MRTRAILAIVGSVGLVLFTIVGAVFAYNGVRQIAIEGNEIAELPLIAEVLNAPSQPTRTPVPIGEATTATVETVDVTEAVVTELPAATIAATEVADAAADSTDADLAAQFHLDAPVDPNRRTILLLGIDQREGEQGPFRTDTMIVLSLDPVRQEGVMLSIPRDLWVSMPGGFQSNRINTANSIGDSSEYPGGGPALAAAVIEQNIGIHIDDTVRVNFDLFLTAVDAIAPVEICVDEVIHDDHYPDAHYGTMTVHFDPGCEEMNAERLLQYARTRATEGSDFDRARRQQQVIQAIKARLLSLGGVQALLGQATSLWDAVREDVQTTLTLEEIVQLAAWAQEIPPENIRQAVLDMNYVIPRVNSSGDQVLLLRPGAALNLVQELFNPLQINEADLRQLAAGEPADLTLSVVNGTELPGLAADTAAWLEAQGFTVAQVGNAARFDHTQTLIKDSNNQNPYTTRLLASTLGIPTTRIQPGLEMPAQGIEVQIVVGQDLVTLIRGGE